MIQEVPAFILHGKSRANTVCPCCRDNGVGVGGREILVRGTDGVLQKMHVSQVLSVYLLIRKPDFLQWDLLPFNLITLFKKPFKRGKSFQLLLAVPEA